MTGGRTLAATLRLPELNVFAFAVLLNFPWEILQAPLFEGMADAPHWPAVRRCAVASVGDGVIMLAAFWAVAVVYGSRRWLLTPTWRQTVGFTAIGLVTTVAVERLAIAGWWPMGWSYSDAMPTVPAIGTGVSPLLQWLLLPPLTMWIVRRQLR